MDKVGIVCVSFLGYHIARNLVRFLYNKWLAPALKRNVNLRDIGPWAAITGCTDGIGRAFAFACAKRGMNVVLISRDLKKLQQTASELEKQYKISTKIIEKDFTDISPESYTKIQIEMSSIEVGVLINNVGMSYSHPEYFLNLPDRENLIMDIIKCNIFSVTLMTNALLPFMLERGRGVVINLSSSAADIPSPLLTVYAASKAYVEKFSRDLASEYTRQGIIIQCLTPGYVVTKMSKVKRSTWLIPNPDQYVESALSSTGIETVTTGYYPHSLMVGVVKTFVAVAPPLAHLVIMNTMESIRQRALSRRQ